MAGKKKLVGGWGINDADYLVKPYVRGKQIRCNYYTTWGDMIRRCYSEKYHTTHPTYIGCSICEEWKYFSNFKSWMEQQDWEEKELDKDLLIKDNKIYSSETCVFISRKLNSFLIDRGNCRGDYPLGVHWDKNANKFMVQCRDGNGNKKYLGVFTCHNEAHEAWRKCKHEIACQYADEQTDPRIAEALRTRFSYEEWYKDKDNTNETN